MKIMHKLLAIVLAIALAASLCVSALAATASYSITVNNTSSSVTMKDNTYYAFKLFDVVYSGDAYAYTISTSSPFYTTDVLDELAAYFTLTQSAGDPTVYNVKVTDGVTFGASEIRALADALEEFLPDVADADGSATASADDTVVINLTEPGYYLVAGTVGGVHDGQAATDAKPEITSAIAVTNADPDGEINVKADAPDIDKFIIDADNNAYGTINGIDNLGKGTAVNVGDAVEFVLFSAIPATTGYTSYDMIIHDVMSDGLTFVNTTEYPVTVTIGDDTLTTSDYTLSNVTTTSFDLSFDALATETVTDTVSGETSTVAKYAAGDVVTVTFYAILNDGALETEYEQNVVKLEYSSNPYDDSDTQETPEHTVYVYDFDIVIDKYAGSGDDEVKLEGAEFVLYKIENGKKLYAHIDSTTSAVTWVALNAEVPATGTQTAAPAETVKDAIGSGKITAVITDTTGAARFAGLDVGTYYLTETEAPDGYNLLTVDAEVKIEANYNTDKSGLLVSSSATRKTTETQSPTGETVTEYGQYEQTKSIENKHGIVLPETGGVGTAIIITVSALVFLGVMVVLVAKKRLYNEAE